MFDDFPYTNFHELNLDWIIKIAKDFLDQYTHIQEVIENGETSILNLTTQSLEDLDAKEDALETALQNLYNGYSADLASALANAIADLNAWYTEHTGYLNNYLTESIAAFQTAATAKAQETLENIPADYSTLSALSVTNNKTLQELMGDLFGYNYLNFIDSYDDINTIMSINSITPDSLDVNGYEYNTPVWLPVNLPNGSYKIKFVFTATSAANIRLFASDKTTLLHYFSTDTEYNLTVSNNTQYYIRLYCQYTVDRLNITQAYIIDADSEYGFLLHKINVPQLGNDLNQFFAKITDLFADASPDQTGSSGMTVTKSDNTIRIQCTANAAYNMSSLQMLANHAYAIAYNLSGTNVSGAISIQTRLYNGSWTAYGPTLTTGKRTVFFTPNVGGEFTFNAPNNVGLDVSGTIYIYDITDIPESKREGLSYNDLGSESVLFVTVNPWTSKKVVFYGDSITAYGYPQIVKDFLHCNIDVNAIGGSRFTYSDSDSLSSDTRIQTLPADADYVIIMGGTNDWAYSTIEDTLTYDNGFDRTKFKGAVAYVITEVQAQCPNAKIIIATNIGGRGTGAGVTQPLPLVSAIGNTALDIRNAEIEVANMLNVDVIDTWSCGINGFNRVTLIADTVHPTEDGTYMIGKYIADCMKKFE